MKEPPHVTRLLGARGLGLLIILSLELERLLLLLRNQIKHEEKHVRKKIYPLMT